MPGTEQETDTGNAGRALARKRWGTQIIDNAITVIETRQADVTPEHAERLWAVLRDRTDAL